MLLGPIFGPILGGWLIDVASWHWIFLINVPIGIGAVVYAAMVLPRDHVEPSESFDFIGMLMLSPGLALLLFGVSSIPQAQQDHGTMWTARVVVCSLIGIVLIAGFVPWALRPANKHPLVDLRLFKDRAMTIAVVAMGLFAIAFFGAGLLFPLYFQQVHGETPLRSGILLAPQGIGAMLTMPAAGMLADKIGPGKVVLTGLVVDVIGLGMFIFTDETTSYAYLLTALFIMGLGMGATMMPIMSAALASLKEASIARGSTLMNITQQVSASIGTALFSVLLTNAFQSHPSIQAANAVAQAAKQPAKLAALLQHFGLQPSDLAALARQANHAMSLSYAHVFLVATILLAFCLIPAAFLPRSKPARTVEPAAVMAH